MSGKSHIEQYTDKESFEEWKARLLRDHGKDSTLWVPLGDEWLCASKSNRAYRQVVYHLCQGNQHSVTVVEDLILGRCKVCGDPVPEGIRMIALLEEL